MTELALSQCILIAIIFVWSGFVRSGLGFGGAVLSLPFLLLVHNDALVFLPIISLQLLFFSGLIFFENYRVRQKYLKQGTPAESTIDWHYLKRALLIMLIPKLIGVFGLISLPPYVMGVIIFTIVTIYSITYILNKPFKSQYKSLDVIFLILGGYVSGTSLIGAPLLTAVFASHVDQQKLRGTLFALWFILVTIKVAAFIYLAVDLQLIHQLWLFPCAAIGHLLGLKFHRKLQSADSVIFYRVMGGVLLLVSFVGLIRTFLT
jgi:uncharacterized membrane protein YfcA